MTRFFYQLTKENWGFPWHMLIAAWGTALGIIVLRFFFPDNIAFTASFVTIQVIGAIYERIQAARADKEGEDWIYIQTEARQDYAANFLGGLFMLVLLVFFTNPL